MKRVFTSLFAVFLCSLVMAQTAPRFGYQAVVRNASNELVADDTVTVGIQFFNHEISGMVVYSEHHSVVSNMNGLISLMIGEGTEATGDLSQVTWDDALMSTVISLKGGYSVTDVRPVAAVPFAYYAERISLRALEEHLGNTNLVSTDALGDTLSHYVTIPGLSDTLTHYVTTSGLTDTLLHYVTVPAFRDSLGSRPTRSELSDSLSHYVTSAALADSMGRCATLSILSDSLANYVPRAALYAAIQSLRDEINAETSIVDVITVTSYHTSSNQFILAHSPMTGRMAMMFINGILISQNAYTVTENRVSYIPENNDDKALEEGDRVQFYYYYK